MTQLSDVEYFNARMHELLEDVPKCVRSFICGYAWERGHSGGYDEVYNLALGLKEDMKEIIAELQTKEVRI
jgi:hypothetical protein